MPLFNVSPADPYTPPDGDWNVTGNVTATGVVKTGSGTAELPAHSFSAYASTGMYAEAGPLLSWSVGGAKKMELSGTAATLQMGANAAAPVAQTFKAHSGSGTDIAGASLTVAGGAGTGTGAGGAVYIATATPAAGPGADVNALVTRSTWAGSTGYQTHDYANVLTTQASEWVLRNPTDALVGTPVQRSPMLVLSGTAHDTGTLLPVTTQWGLQVRPASANPVFDSSLVFTRKVGAAAWVDAITFNAGTSSGSASIVVRDSSANTTTLSTSSISFTGAADFAINAIGAGFVRMFGNVAAGGAGTDFQVYAKTVRSAGYLTKVSVYNGASYDDKATIAWNGAIVSTVNESATTVPIGANIVAGYTWQNTTAAADAAQQWSPATVWSGQGWTGAANQSVRFAAYVTPVQSGTLALSTWNLASSVNGAAWSTPLLSIYTGNNGVVITGPLNVSYGGICGIQGTQIGNAAVNTAAFALYGGVGASSGIKAYGSTHATLADVVDISTASTVRTRWSATGNMTHTYNAMGAAVPGSGAVQGFELTNTTDAIDGTVQMSPMLVWTGQCFETTGNTTQPVKMAQCFLPTQWTSSGGTFYWKKSINGAAWADVMSLTTSGYLNLPASGYLLVGSGIVTGGGHYSLADTGYTFLMGGVTNTSGLVYTYGATHATKAKMIELVSDSIVRLKVGADAEAAGETALYCRVNNVEKRIHAKALAAITTELVLCTDA